MLINCIHDARRTDRMELVKNEIREHSLQVRFWPAIQDPLMSFRGICNAHKQIVRWAQDKKMPMVCIAEDDFKMTDKRAWKYFTDNIPSDFDLYLSGIYYGFIKSDNTVDDFCALHLYIVHERFYSHYLSIPDRQNLDRAFARRGRFVVSKPFCAIQHPGYSDNKKRYAQYDHLLKGRELCCK